MQPQIFRRHIQVRDQWKLSGEKRQVGFAPYGGIYHLEKKGLKTKRDTDFQWKRFPFSAIFTWCSTIGGKYYTCRAFKSDWLALDLLRRIQICNLSSAILSCGQSWEHSCSLLCDPGMNHRQPLLMVESSRAIHSPITLSRGSVFRNEASWCGVTKRHKPQKARLR